MIKVTRWHPDTCGCVIDYEWDTETTAETRVHTPVSIQACEHHQVNTWDEVRAENKRKNDAVVAAGVDDVQWELDSERNVVLRVPQNRRAQVLDAVSGMPRVRVE